MQQREKVSTRKIGEDWERIAGNYLEKNGWKIIDTNWTKLIGELDIIAKKNGKVHFIEVKLRKSNNYSPAIENLTPLKKRRFLKMGLLWASFHNLEESQYQFDCITIEKKMTTWRVSHFLNIEL
jgi:putative endonuclease